MEAYDLSLHRASINRVKLGKKGIKIEPNMLQISDYKAVCQSHKRLGLLVYPV